MINIFIYLVMGLIVFALLSIAYFIYAFGQLKLSRYLSSNSTKLVVVHEPLESINYDVPFTACNQNQLRYDFFQLGGYIPAPHIEDKIREISAEIGLQMLRDGVIRVESREGMHRDLTEYLVHCKVCKYREDTEVSRLPPMY